MAAMAAMAADFGVFDWRPVADHGLGQTASDLRVAVALARKPATPPREEELAANVLDAIGDSTLSSEIPFETLAHVVYLLESLPTAIPLPRIIVESSREIGLDWDFANDAVVSVTVDGSDRIGYSALIGREATYGLVPVGDAIPSNVTTLVRRAIARRGD